MHQLSLVVCSQCGTKVFPTSSGICPSCREQLVEATPEQEAAFLEKKRSEQAALESRRNEHPYVKALRRATEFSGRSQKSEYWTFVLVNWAVVSFLAVAEVLMGGIGIVTVISGLFFAIPTLAVNIRRLHDSDHSGRYLLISCIPIFGIILLFALMLLDSDPRENRYGPNPKIAP